MKKQTNPWQFNATHNEVGLDNHKTRHISPTGPMFDILYCVYIIGGIYECKSQIL